MERYLIDLHSHICWGVDDGIASKEDSIEVLRQAKEDGIIGICSTPHVIPGKTSRDEFHEMLYRQQELMSLGKEFDVFVYSGAEMFMNIDFIDALDQGIYQTLNESKYMLLEFDLTRNIHHIGYIDEYLEEVYFRGMIPVIAHVERFFPEGLDIDLIESWYERGYLFQTNRTSILGFHGKTIQRNAMHLLSEKRIHLIATDTHSTIGNRITRLNDVYGIVEKRFGKGNADLLFKENPLAILNNSDVYEME